jgi:hypothetical protein
MYAKINNGIVEKFPYSIGNLRKDNPQTSFPKNPTDELLARWNVLPIADVPQPAHDQATQTVDEFPPVFVNGRWERNYAVRAKTADELAQAQQQLQNEIVEATQQRLDAFAQTKNYDNANSCISYQNSSVPTFAAEGQKMLALRDQTWLILLGVLNDVKDGLRVMPSGYADIEGDLPVLSWN